jgi:hypothetical protein
MTNISQGDVVETGTTWTHTKGTTFTGGIGTGDTETTFRAISGTN